MQRCLFPLFQNQSPTFCCPLLGQDQQNNKQTSCRLSIIIFLWTPKGFISPEYFLNFLLNLYIPPWLRKSFKLIVLRLHLWVKILNLFNFTYAPKQNYPPGFYHYRPCRRELPIHPEQHFLKTIFPEQKEEEEDYVVEKITKINKGTGHDFWQIPPYLQPLHFWFMFCCAII